MIFMFTLFMLMLKDDLFCLLKKLVFISSFFFCPHVKIPIIFWRGCRWGGGGGCVIYIQYTARGEGSVILDGIRLLCKWGNFLNFELTKIKKRSEFRKVAKGGGGKNRLTSKEEEPLFGTLEYLHISRVFHATLRKTCILESILRNIFWLFLKLNLIT